MSNQLTKRADAELYAFASGEWSRRQASSSVAISNLCDRLKLDRNAVTCELEPLLVRYYTSYDLNVEWYDKKISEWEDKQVKSTEHLQAVGLLGVLLLAGATVWGSWHAAGGSVVGAQLGFIIAGVIAALQIATTGKDYKAQRGAFYKARSSLKARLYAFEDVWSAKTCDANNKVKPEFHTALVLELRAADDIVENERQEYFDTFKSAADVVSSIQGALTPAVSQSQQLLQTARESAHRNADPVEDARKNDIAAAARIEVAQMQVDALSDRAPDDADLKSAKLALVKAKADRAGTQFLLQAATGRST